MSERSCHERFHVELHEGADHDRVRVLEGGTPMSRLGLFEALRDDAAFRAFFKQTIRAVRFEAFLVSVPAETRAVLNHMVAALVLLPR